jgi:two-component system, LytTR family, sensor kinase
VDRVPPFPRTAPAIVAAFLAVGLLNAMERWFQGTSLTASAFGSVAWREFLRAGVWLALAPAVAALCRWFPLKDLRRPRVAAAHFAGLVFFPVAQIVLNYAVFNLILAEPLAVTTIRRELWLSLGLFSHFNVLTYVGLLGALWALALFRGARERELAASRLDAQLAAARLTALKMQLQPHFLFNTLNTILPLLYTRPEAATRTLVDLGELVRIGLRTGPGPFVPLETELSFLSRYLDIERTRFEDRLTVTWTIDAATREASVPSLLLQPLVENAIKYGVAARPGPVHVEILARRTGSRLALAVRDDGPGLPRGGTEPPRGVGLANTRARLRQLYGERHLFSIADRPGGGVEAILVVPFARHAGAPAGAGPGELPGEDHHAVA